MSFNLEGQSCPVCHSYLFEDDDIVYCPECGVPHHRDCYKSVGHCGLESLHGTENQYDLVKTKTPPNVEPEIEPPKNINIEDIKCPKCGERFDKAQPRCPKCGTVNITAGLNIPGFDLLGGVPADYDIGEGVTADNAKQFVVTNTHRYIPKFASLNNKNKTSWNWLAFLLPSAWFFLRKMYKCGIFTAILTVTSSLLTIPITKAMYAVGISYESSYTEIIDIISSNIPNLGKAALILAFAGFIMNLAVRVFSAIMGDYYYKKYTIASIKKICSQSTDTEYDYRKLGGLSFIAFIISFLALEYLPMLISIFL